LGTFDYVEYGNAVQCKRKTERPIPGQIKKYSHWIKKPLGPQRSMFRERRGGVDVSTYFEGYDFAIGERLDIEVIYATVICGLPLYILIIRTICGE
jgi:hypothetical protein